MVLITQRRRFIYEAEIDENEREIVDIDGDSADGLEEEELE